MNRLQELLIILEGKEDYVEKNFGEKLLDVAKKEKIKDNTAGKVVKELAKVSDKHLVWVARMYIAGHFKFEDVPRMKDELTKFDKHKNKMEKKDLNAYKDVSELYAALDKIDPEDDKKKLEFNTKEKDVEWIINSPNYKVLIPKTKEASCKYGAGTRWCTAASSNNMFDHYAKTSDLIIIIAKMDDKWRKFQFHFNSGSFMDENDRAAQKTDIKALSKFPEHIKMIHLLIDKYHPETDDE